MDRLLCIRIFPLPGVVLFPDARLPLHIFEPRYRAMTEDSLVGDHTIGMVLPTGESTDDEPPPVYRTGCLGVVTQSRRLEDGRFHLLLEGRRRFHILEEQCTDKPYRSVRAELLDDPSFAELPEPEQQRLHEARRRLESLILELVRTRSRQDAAQLAEQMKRLDPIQLAHALAFSLDCSSVEKQHLLETEGPAARCDALIEALEFRRLQLQHPDTPDSVN